MANISIQIDTLATRLEDDNIDLKIKLSLATELRDVIDVYQNSSDYEHFLSKLINPLLHLLETVPISFTSSSVEHRLRNCILDVLLRLQTNETLKPYAQQILKLVMELLRTENEENGVVCMKILTSLHRSYKTYLMDQVQPFLDLVIEIYKNIPQTVKDVFSGQQQISSTTTASVGTPATPATFQSPRPLSPSLGSDLGIEMAPSKQLQNSLHSFKVLTECPIIVVLLYSTHKQLSSQSLPVFIPHIIEMLSLQAAPQAKAHAAAEARNEIYTSISPQIKNRSAYAEFITAQVKTMSFLAYALRGSTAELQKHHAMIPDFVVRLLQDCPCELSAARKELLVATRHILSTDFRTIFIPKVDILLNEKVLIGEGLTVHETLRPLAYSTMADLVHHVRSELTPDQIWKTVRVYCRNMQDDSLATSFQIMSAKLLLNLVERIMKLPSRAEGRQIMVLILNAFVERFGSLNRTYNHVMKHERLKEQQVKKIDEEAIDVNSQEDITSPKRIKLDTDGFEPSVEDSNESLDFLDILNYTPIQIHTESSPDKLKDARYLFKNLMTFLKTVMFGLKSCNPPPPNEYMAAQWSESARMFNYEEVTIFRRLFREGIAGHQFFAGAVSPTGGVSNLGQTSFDLGTPSLPIASSKDEKDLMETFATVFIHIDPACFNEIVEAELPTLYGAMFNNTALLHIPQFFLASEATSSNFSGILISFLKNRLPELGDGDPVKSNILIRLFKLCFMAVSLFPTANETVILPHLRELIVQSMELTTTAKEPIVYFHLLRTLFRSIGSGRFEQLYKEVLPLLQVLLDSLNKLIETARKPAERDIYVELCLTVPVRLSVLVPHLSYLMRPLVIALNGSQELITQGLRTLELCVDNLTAEYFDPIIEPVIGEVMQALWKHLKPLPYYHQHSHTTLRILGKLGGRNRRFLGDPTSLGADDGFYSAEVTVSLNFVGIPDKKPMKVAAGVQSALKVLEDPRAPSHYRNNAYEYLSTVLKLFLNSSVPSSDDDNTYRKYYEKTTPQGNSSADSSPSPPYAYSPEDYLAVLAKSCVDVIRSPNFPETSGPLPDGSEVEKSKLILQNKLFERLAESIFYSVSVKETRESALQLIKDLCEHFVVLELGEIVIDKRKAFRSFELKEHEGEPRLDHKGLLHAIVYALSHYIPEIKEAGRSAIKYIFETGQTLFGGADDVQKFPLFKSLFGTLTHTCFEEQYYRKEGACLGLETIIKDLALPVSWFTPRQLEFVRTMFFVLKDVPSDVPCAVKSRAKALMLYVLEECNRDITPERMQERVFKQLTGLLAYELGHANVSVREASREALEVVSRVSGLSIASIMEPVKSVLLSPIFGKPLRALPFPMQIGHIDAITFCMGLDGTFLEVNDELMRLLLEALALVDAEDDSLTSAHRVFEHRVTEQLTQLRIVCIRLLALALTRYDYFSNQHPQTKGRIIAVFFKTLYSRSNKVIDAANEGLKTVLAQNNKLPKELLQNGLRPILMNLSDHKRLKVPGLEGLARLLDLLTNYFKVEIGKKLLDHLRAWAEVPQLYQNSVKTLSSQYNINIIVAILNIFHLLPPTAYLFMNDLIRTLNYLETHLRRQHDSPFREPIAKFLDRYSQESFQYFVPKLSDRDCGRLFASMLAMPTCKNLRKYVKENIGDIRKVIEEGNGIEKSIAICNVVAIVSSISSCESEDELSKTDLAVVKAEPSTFKTESTVSKQELSVVKTPDIKSESSSQRSSGTWLESQKALLLLLNTSSHELMKAVVSAPPISPLNLQIEQSLEELQRVFVKYLREKPRDVQFLLAVTTVLCAAKVKVSAEFHDFIFSDIVSSKDVDLRKLYLSGGLDCATSRSSGIDLRTFIFHNIINPILIVEGHRNGNLTKLLDKYLSKSGNWLDVVHLRIWRPSVSELSITTGPGSEESSSASPIIGTIDHYRLELLQLTALLIKLGPNLVADPRKDIIRFGWSFIKLEDIISKQAANVLIAYFIAAYDTLPKITLNYYVSLLRAHQNEGKRLVKQSLDLLAPVIAQRLRESSLYAKWPRRVLSEDGHNVSQVINIYQYIVRHPELFYEYRDHFISNIISAIPKLCFVANASSENQVLAVDLAELVLKWERMSSIAKAKASAAAGGTEKNNGDAPTTNSPVVSKRKVDQLESGSDDSHGHSHSSSTHSSYTVPFAQREACITYLIRFVCISPQKVVDNVIGQRIIKILDELLGPDNWPEVDVRLTFFDRSLIQNDFNSPNGLAHCLNALEVISITLKRKSSEWILSNLGHLEKLFEKCIRSENPEIQTCLHKVLKIILGAVDKSTEDDDQEKVQSFLTLLTTVVQESLSSNTLGVSGIMISWSLVNFKPASIDPLLPSIMKSFGKLCKDYISHAHGSAEPSPTNTATNSSVNATATVAVVGAVSGNGSGSNTLPAGAAAGVTSNATGANAPAGTSVSAASGVSGSNLDPPAESKLVLNLLTKILDLTSMRISYLGDQRRAFLSLFAQLIERSLDKGLCLKMISIVRHWVFENTESFPTTKEKASILSKMMSFEARGDVELTAMFYEIVVEIYTTPSTARSELAARMEHAFLSGTKFQGIKIRQRLMNILNDSLDSNALKRLSYVISDQNWEYIGDYQWINQALQILYGGTALDADLEMGNETATLKVFKTNSLGNIIEGIGLENIKKDVEKIKKIDNSIEKHQQDGTDADGDTQVETGVDLDEKKTDEQVAKASSIDIDRPSSDLLALSSRLITFIRSISHIPTSALLKPLSELHYQSSDLVHEVWIDLFPQVYSGVANKDRNEMVRALVALLSKDYHNRQIDKRPNVVQTLLTGVGPVEQLPPHLVKFLGGAFCSWYSSIQILENIESDPIINSAKISDGNLDALAELYAGLQEDDMFYGLWRRRAKYTETNSALSYEQCGMWSRAMQMYEAAQIKARSGVLPYGESEYGLWEDHWILSAQKLQQWDILTELAKHEGFTDLLLECGWRVADWTTDKEPLEQSIKTVMDVPTPRRQVFETFICLQGYAQKTETIQELSRYCDEGIQLALRKWYGLPSHLAGTLTGAHIPLLHTFQQYVEFMEASQVYTSLATTTALNLDTKSQELKGVLQAWRERLPNIWDDINIWGDLVTWRQHAFGVINKVYLPLIGQGPNGQGGAAGSMANNSGASGGSGASNSYAYRGFHEIAWIVNRFAHVARKHDMPEVCINQLTKIYTLPNIEIQEAFLKLREQAKCHYQNPNEMNTGLDVISNTNLVYFGAQQKAEFFTLKGMFLAKLNVQEEANQAFATAVQIDLYLPKAWAEWGYFNDRRFKEHPEEIIYAGNAISCYLQAAGLYKNGKTRKLLSRILWLISLDDPNGTIAQSFDSYRGEVPVWYWITFIPQLLTSLSHKEGRLVRVILIKIAKSYPQALHFHLRTTKEDYAVLQRQALVAKNAVAKGGQNQPQAVNGSAQQSQSQNPSTQSSGTPNGPNGPNGPQSNSGGTPGTPISGSSSSAGPRQPWDYVEEIMGILKTAYPLLALSLETLIDQIYQRFKCPVDEDAYRLIVALLNDAVQFMGRVNYPKDKLPPATESNITKFAESVLPKHVKAAFEADFVTDKPNLETYIKKLRKWRNRFEEKLDRRPATINLEALSPHLSEFHYQKFEDVEVPGQYLELKDNNLHFVKIDRFMSTVDIVRGFGICYRRITILGSDGAKHPFAVQYPAARICRREERVAQLFKILNGVLSRRKESRKRHLQFTLPVAIPLSPHIRLVQDDPRYISLQAIYESYCKKMGQNRDAPLDYATDRMRAAYDPKLPKPDIASIRMEILSAIQATLVPTTVLRDHFFKAYSSFADFWLFRKQFSYQYAGITFMTFLMSINNRYPHKMLINSGTGNIWPTEMLPTPTFHNGEPVPFRLTPNIQTLMGPTCLEGLYSVSIMVIARFLTEPEFNLEQYLSIFVRDELISWYMQNHRPTVQDQQLREIVRVNVEAIVKRASSLAQVGQGNIPANQTVIDLISQAVNPRHMALTDNLWMPYL